MLSFVPTPIGNIADISLRALDVLGDAELFLCEDTRITKQLLLILQERYNLLLRPNVEFLPLHSHNEEQFFQNIDKEIFKKNVVYMSDAGMPCVSDPGAKLVAYAQKNGIAYDVLPGSNAVLTAYAASGFDATQFLFFGFLPHKTKARSQKLQELLQSGYVGIVYEAPHRLEKLLEELTSLAPQREIFLAKELTKRYQRYFKGYPKELLAQLKGQIKGEWVVVIDKATATSTTLSLSVADILELDLPKKQKAKLLAQVSEKSAKEWYSELV